MFEQFVKEKIYLKGVTPKTVSFYKQSWAAYLKHTDGEISKNNLTQFVVALKEKGMSAAGANSYIRGVNSYLTWLYENGYITEHLKMKQLKPDFKVMTFLSDTELKAILSFKPRTFGEKRLYALICLLADTGARIEEALTLTCSRIDFDNLLLTVNGKSNKERIIPFSPELRKVLFKYLRNHKHSLVFCSRKGTRLLYDNCRRDLNLIMDQLGIKTEGSFHVFRRTFARNYVRFGGNLFYLQQCLGHADLKTTRGYVRVDIDALQETHVKTSLLSRLR
jgi:integrase/recombinase XerD